MSFNAVVSGDTAITARGPLKSAAERLLGRLWIDEVPVRLASEDPSLWPSAAAALEEARALCWPAQPGPGRAALGRMAELRERARADGLTDVLLLGRGAPAHAARLIVDAHHRAALQDLGAHLTAPNLTGPNLTAPNLTGPNLTGHGVTVPSLPLPAFTVLDGPDPGPPLRLADDPDRLARTMIVVTGDDPGTDALRRVLDGMLRDLGLSPGEVARRFVTVAEPRSAAAKIAIETGHPLVEAPAPTPFGALSPYTLVPAALAGADVAALLDEATAVLPSLTRPEHNPGLALGAILAGAVRSGRGTAVLGGYPAALPGIASWVALLLEETARGRLTPVVQDGGLPLSPAEDMFLVTFDGRPHQDDATVSGPLAAQLVVWEYAAAVASHLLEIDPLAPRDGTAPMTLDDGSGDALFADGDPALAVEAHTTVPGLAVARDLPELLDELIARVADGEHLVIVAYLDPDESRGEGTRVRRLAARLAARSGRPVAARWGTGLPAFWNDQEDGGVYLMVTGNVVRDVPVPGRHHRLGMVQLARALGDAKNARAAGLPVVRLHLRDRRAGLTRLLDSAREGE